MLRRALSSAGAIGRWRRGATVDIHEDFDLAVSTQGDVSAEERRYAEEKFRRVAELAPERVLHARLRLTLGRDPARARPAIVKGALDLGGHILRAHVAAATMREATDFFEHRMRDRLDRITERPRSGHLRSRDAGPGEWHHGDAPSRRPEFFDRPVDEREIVRRKEFAVEAETPDEAVFDMESLHHDFFLFTNVDSNEENLVWRAADGSFEIIQPTPAPERLAECAAPIRLSAIVPSRLRLEDALELLNAGDHPYVFFLDAETGRGTVVYRRYDGHYGVIAPAVSRASKGG